ncbi:MAG: esterase-like activity of phytase family protein [Niabella sp.]
MRFLSIFLTAAILLAGCSASKKAAVNVTKDVHISSLKFLDEYDIPYNTHFNNTWVGGLSGIDYDRQNNRYFIISDERSATSAARFYTAAIDISDNKIDSVRFLSVASLRNAKNDTFPSLQTVPEHAADPESMRYNPVKNMLVWSSEGDKAVRSGRMVYQNPWIFEMDTNGNFKDSFLIPANLHMYVGDSGARENGVLEGLSFTGDYKFLWASMESPVYEDGPVASPGYGNAIVRFTKFDADTRKPVAQYGYLLDAVANNPVPENAFNVNGISENLYIGNNKFLVLERSFSTGVAGCVIKIYLADFSRATNVSGITSLYQNTSYTPASKTLLFNFNSLNRLIDNVEGITLGPVLPDGHLSLLLIVDNNFNPFEPQQVFLFEIIP